MEDIIRICTGKTYEVPFLMCFNLNECEQERDKEREGERSSGCTANQDWNHRTPFSLGLGKRSQRDYTAFPWQARQLLRGWIHSIVLVLASKHDQRYSHQDLLSRPLQLVSFSFRPPEGNVKGL